jgi:hypothetical protein
LQKQGLHRLFEHLYFYQSFVLNLKFSGSNPLPSQSQKPLVPNFLLAY